MIKVAINGFGRIGRLTLRRIEDWKEKLNLEVVAVNDLSTPEMMAYLLKYDSIHGAYEANVKACEGGFTINGRKILTYAVKNPVDLPWKELDIDLVLECTGVFNTKDKASLHLEAGAKKVIISAPGGKDVRTAVYGVNHHDIQKDDKIISTASCTTNCLAPMAKVLNDHFGIEVGQMTTIHAYTNSQNLMDAATSSGKFRDTRAAAENIIPHTTGAAKAIALVIPELAGKLDGAAQRVPLMTGSIVELYTILSKKTTVEEINAAMKAAENEAFEYNDDHIVSSDVIGNTEGSIFDATLTKIVEMGDKQLVKTAAWYDNEYSFISQMIRIADYYTK